MHLLLSISSTTDAAAGAEKFIESKGYIHLNHFKVMHIQYIFLLTQQLCTFAALKISQAEVIVVHKEKEKAKMGEF